MKTLRGRLLRRLGIAGERQERGAVLVLVTFLLIVILGMAAFAVDLGWLYYRATQTKKAAESAALAAVVHLPLPTPVAPGTDIAGSTAADAALAVAGEHGYGSAVVRRWNTAAQVRVDIADNAKTFFMRIFGIDQVSYTRNAVAEQLPPLKLGSDEPHLGTVPGVFNEHFWVAMNGLRRQKEDGDPFAPQCLVVQGGSHGNERCASGNVNYRNPAYFYAVDVPPEDVGDTVTVQIYDGPQSHMPANLPEDIGSTSGPESEIKDRMLVNLYQPDVTPADPTDNSVLICSDSFEPDGAGTNSWDTICSFTATRQGIHVLSLAWDESRNAVLGTGPDEAINAFSLRVNSPSGNAPVYGIAWMSVWMRDVNTVPSFQLVKLEEVYAGTELVVSLFDPGDIFGSRPSGSISFVGEASTMDCRVRVRNHDGTTILENWRNDDSTGAPCDLVTAPPTRKYNNLWVDFAFRVPPDYTCAGDCWIRVDYSMSGGSPSERTTWGARINGQPIHLLPEGT